MPKDVPETRSAIVGALGMIPHGLFVLTSSYGEMRSGLLAKWVQPCASEPPHVMVAVARGTPVEPLIRDSRAFALCQISAGDRLLRQSFIQVPDRNDDPFLTLPAHEAPSGSPIIDRALAYLDCELVRHVVLDADYRLYVGLIHHGDILNRDATPAVGYGSSGPLGGITGFGTNGANGTGNRLI
jgi:flavin reductase (DIM6/NTAB) family NADH-FMN oxidoreductase RutF